MQPIKSFWKFLGNRGFQTAVTLEIRFAHFFSERDFSRPDDTVQAESSTSSHLVSSLINFFPISCSERRKFKGMRFSSDLWIIFINTELILNHNCESYSYAWSYRNANRPWDIRKAALRNRWSSSCRGSIGKARAYLRRGRSPWLFEEEIFGL